MVNPKNIMRLGKESDVVLEKDQLRGEGVTVGTRVAGLGEESQQESNPMARWIYRIS